MRKFIISDIHGSGEVYDSIMAYLENISANEEVELYINGDLIDRGLDSYRVFLDAIDRICGIGNIKIKYLGGNHELMMYESLNYRRPNQGFDSFCDWFYNGGYILAYELEEEEDFEERCEFFKELLGNLDIYYKFEEKINGKPILLVHACAPKEVKDKCDMKIKDDDGRVFDAVWKRRERRYPSFFDEGRVMGYNKLGKEGYITILGHTPVDDIKGFTYDAGEDFFNIDGGCAYYANAYFEKDLVPLVEVKDGYLKFIVFNHNNEIVNGYIFDGKLKNMEYEDIEYEKQFISNRFNNVEMGARKRIKNSLIND